MSRGTVYVALGQFCEHDDRPRQVLVEAGFKVRENTTGRRIRREEMLEALRDADAVLAGVEPYAAELLAALPRLRCISRCGVGTDGIDLAAAGQRRIAILTTPDEVVEPVAQMTVAMMLALARNLPLHLSDARDGLWRKHTGHLLSEWTIGLVGFGRIGRAVAGHLRGFGPRVLVADPNVDSSEVPDGIELSDLSTLLQRADVVSLHASRPPEQGPLIGARELAAMKRGSRLVNTARGFLVEESALLNALASGQLAGAALDVFESEPYSGPLAGLPQVLCTPHVASLTRASRAAMELRCASNVVAYFEKSGAGVGAVSAGEGGRE